MNNTSVVTQQKFQTKLLDIFVPPIKTTPCGHNYCESCLLRVSEGRRHWECPQSRQAHNIAVKLLPRNFLIERMVERFKKESENQSGTCQKHNRPIEISKSY